MTGLPSEETLLRRLDKASRAGSVSATVRLLEELRRGDDEEESELDRLDGGNVSPIRRRGA